MHCALLRLSIDGRLSHLAWTGNVQQKFGISIPVQIIDGIQTDVAPAYARAKADASNTQAVRAAFFIDPKGTLHAVVQAMQTSAKHA